MSALLLVGAEGMFGTDATPVFSAAGYEVQGADLPEMDITSPESVASCMGRFRPEIVVNAAAYTQVDRAESEPEAAFRTNGEGVRNLAIACRDSGALLVQLSTDYVFAGEKPEGYLPTDEPGPAPCVYGASKLAGEEALLSTLPPGGRLLCRTQWLYGSRGPNFVETILHLASQREEIQVVDDQWGVPTAARDLASQIVALLRGGARGTYHAVGGGGPVTWFTFAAAVVEMAGLPCRVTPCTTEAFPRPARRPKTAWLRNEGVPGTAVRPWRDALREHLAARARRPEKEAL